MVRQSLIKAIRGSECLCKNAPLKFTRRRAFTNSAVCQKGGSIPSFQPTSSPELDQLLSKYRSKLFVPAQLSEYDRRIVFHPEESKTLLNEPRTVEIGGEEFTLEPISFFRDQPSRRKGFAQLLKLMEEANDWNNLPRLLEGLVDCKCPLKPYQQAKMVRRVALNNRMDIIIECARRVVYTGFRLNRPELVKAVMWGLHITAANSNWDVEKTKQALRWAEMVAEMLEDKEHAGSAVVGENDVRTLPEVIGTLLELSAVRASRHLEGKDVDGKVATYAARMVGMPGKNLTIEIDENDGRAQTQMYAAKNEWLKEAVLIIHGMKEALRVLDPDTRPRHRLMDMLPPLEKQAKQYVWELKRDYPDCIGIKTYQQLIGSA